MARTRRKSSKSKSGGSTLFGILVGLILGLAAAVAVALFVTQVPMPFMDKASRDPAKVLLPDVRDAPDPNIGLSGTPAPGTGSAPMPFGAGPTDGAIKPQSDDIGNLIASLNTPKPAAVVTKPAVPATTPIPPLSVPGTEAPKPTAVDQASWLLQAGAFRSENDAEATKARILLLGLPVQVQQAQVNGATLFRVRVGPFKGVDEMNRSRVLLSDEKIESSVVRQ
ncbi:SPOR domain-containing protein [Alcaligenaceae bacterium]|nr:SPOR domain-containing protein [Alcaligenaceae bacterium]